MADSQELIGKVVVYVEQYMNKFDGSHDFNHIKRVVGLAHEIYSKTVAVAFKTPIPQPQPQLDLTIITLCALLHDVGDRKYLKENEDANALVLNLLLEFGATRDLAEKVQTICSAVSYSNEVKDEGYVRELVGRWPELGIVQDADRLDSLGAVGLGRIFTYGGARTSRVMDDSMSLLDIKLYKLEGMMKTDVGRGMEGGDRPFGVGRGYFGYLGKGRRAGVIAGGEETVKLRKYEKSRKFVSCLPGSEGLKRLHDEGSRKGREFEDCQWPH